MSPPKLPRERNAAWPRRLPRRKSAVSPPKLLRQRNAVSLPKLLRRRNAVSLPKLLRQKNAVSPPKLLRQRNAVSPPKLLRQRNAVSLPKLLRQRNAVSLRKLLRQRNAVSLRKLLRQRNAVSPPKLLRQKNAVSLRKLLRQRNAVSLPKLLRQKNAVSLAEAEAAAVAEERRVAAEAAAEEERRIAAAAAEEERRRVAEAAAEEERRLAAEAAAIEERRLAAEAAAAEERRVEAEAAAEEQRRRAAAEAAAEEERRRAEAAAEEERLRAAEAAALQLALEKARALVPEFTAPEPSQHDLMASATIELIDEEPAEQIVEPAAASFEVPVANAEPIRTEPLEHIELLEPLEAAPHSVVLPMTRTVRIEVPPRIPASRSSDIERLLRIAAARGASALFLTSESRPYMRVEGDIRPLENEARCSRADVEAAIVEIAPETARHERSAMGEATEWLKEYPELGRIRCTTFTDHRGPGLMLRMIATRAATAEQLGLSREVQALATEPQGLVLVAGPRASGKSTLMSALVDLVNRQRAEFVITLERQIRLVHDNKAALVSQREIRGGADEALAAARSALRESPDVLVVDDLISPHMVPLLLDGGVGRAAGVRLDRGAVHVGCGAAVRRAGAARNAQRRSERDGRIVPRRGGAGAAQEDRRRPGRRARSAARHRAGGARDQRRPARRSCRTRSRAAASTAWCRSPTRWSITCASGTVDVREAFRKAPDRDRLLAGLKREGIDTSVVERLA